MADDIDAMAVTVGAARGRPLRSMNEYAREVRPHLPAAVFQREPGRLLWLPFHLAVIATLSAFVIRTGPPCYIALACGIVIGHSWGCLGFLAHESLHHAVVKSRAIERLIAYIALLPYCLSPALWVAWHNQTHHAYTGHLFADTDHFGTLHIWKRSRYLQRFELLTPGSWTLWSVSFFFISFTLQGLLMLLVQSQQRAFYQRISRRAVYAETASMVLLWLGTLYLVRPWNFLFVAVVPALSANALLMSYIATNHSLCSLTSTNDPLANSLSVTSPRWVEALHLQFGYHVEHHLFPTMSLKHGREVREVLVRLYSSRYLSLPHIRALRLLYTRPKVHLAHDTLVNPRTMEVFRTLGPADLSMPVVSPSAPAQMRVS